MDAVSKKMLVSLNEKKTLMLQQIQQWCEINSGTDNLPGLARMHQTLMAAFRPVADEIKTIPFSPVTSLDMNGREAAQPVGNALLIRKRPDLKRRMLLSGHMDTVYPADSSFQHVTVLNENRLSGPGISDMKGGLCVMLHALMAFEGTAAAASMGWDVLINADEEISSPASGVLLDEMASNYQAALVYEPALDAKGTLARNRKGSGKLTLVATGVSAHAGRAFDEGRNAICHLAEAIMAIHALNGKRHGVTINVGKMAGGTALNIVPDKAVAKLDVRISAADDERWVRVELDNIIKSLQRKEATLSLSGHFGRPVKRVNDATSRFFELVKQTGSELGFNINWQDSGGCCDGNNLARLGLPVIDSMGVRGGLIHSHDEFILTDSLVERTSLSALLLVNLANGCLEELNL